MGCVLQSVRYIVERGVQVGCLYTNAPYQHNPPHCIPQCHPPVPVPYLPRANDNMMQRPRCVLVRPVTCKCAIDAFNIVASLQSILYLCSEGGKQQRLAWVACLVSAVMMLVGGIIHTPRFDILLGRCCLDCLKFLGKRRIVQWMCYPADSHSTWASKCNVHLLGSMGIITSSMVGCCCYPWMIQR